MRDHDWLIPVAFGLGLAALVATTVMRLPEISTGDWLSFAGALLGVGLGVFGAIASHDRNLRTTRAQKLGRIADAFWYFEIAAYVSEADAPVSIGEKPQRLLLDRHLGLGRVIRMVEAAIASTEIDDMILWDTLITLTDGFNVIKQKMNDQSAFLRKNPNCGDEQFTTFYNDLGEALAIIRPAIRRVKDRIAEISAV